MTDDMTDEERAELEILRMADEKCKIGFSSSRLPDLRFQAALERLQLKEWIRLIDVTPYAREPNSLFRIFMLTQPALAYLKKHAH